MEGIQDLGQRIVQAARMAVAVHLYESVARHTDPHGDAIRVARQILRRRVATGGAGPRGAHGGVEHQPTSPRLGDLVTDDERDGLMGVYDGDDDDEPDLNGTGRDGAD